MVPLKLLCLLLLFGHGMAYLFEIRASLSELNLSRDESLEIECFFNPDESVTETGLNSVDEIHIIRKDTSDKWTEIAKLQANGRVEKGITDVSVFGNIGFGLNGTFLKIYREHASEDDVGIYRCDAVVKDENFRLDVEESNLLTMSKHNLTLEEVSEISQRQIDNLQSDFDKFRLNAQKKLARLEKSVKQLKNESQNQDDKSDDDVTKEDLNQLKEDITRSVLANVSAQVDALSCSRLTQCLISDVIRDDDTAQEEDDLHLDGQQEDSNPEDQQETTVQSPQPHWPSGGFGLLKPNSGCPLTNLDAKWSEGYKKYHTESVDLNHDNVTYGHHLAKPALEVSQPGKHFVYMHFCVSNNVNSLDEPWPVGAYCINRVASKCPADFASGFIDFDEEDTEYEGTRHGILPDMLFFCCRNDGSPDTPVTLPNSMPFYLYRFGGKCQQVTGMQVTPERILFDTENSPNKDWYENEFHPDGKIADVEMELCYYS